MYRPICSESKRPIGSESTHMQFSMCRPPPRLTTDCSALPRVRNWRSTVRVFSATMAVSPSSSPLLLEGSAIMADAIAIVVSGSLQRKGSKKELLVCPPQSSFQFFSSY
jgi:hypothetical protein